MALTEGFRVQSGDSATQLAAIDASGRLAVRLPLAHEEVGAVRAFTLTHIIAGNTTGDDDIRSPESDDDYRWRVSRKIILDQERFRYAAQNTGKHTYTNITMTAAWGTNGLLLNSGGITTISTGVCVSTRAAFPLMPPGVTTYEWEFLFNDQPTTNTTVLFGAYLQNTFAAIGNITPLDGIYFRLRSSGFDGVVNKNGTETSVAFTDTFTYTNDTVVRFRLVVNRYLVQWIINDEVYAEATMTSTGTSPMWSAVSFPMAFQHTITGGAAGVDFHPTVLSYRITQNGLYITRDSGEFGNAVRGSYQGLSGDTMGSLASYANSANPTAAVPTNTTALVTGLGGQAWETDTLAASTDGIIFADQVPDPSITQRRLVIAGVRVVSFIQTALVNGGYVAQWSLAFGSTSLDLGTTESEIAKAHRRIALGSQAVAANAAANTILTPLVVQFTSPVYVNPGEYVAVVRKKVGTAPDSGTVAHLVIFDYTWE